MSRSPWGAGFFACRQICSAIIALGVAVLWLARCTPHQAFDASCGQSEEFDKSRQKCDIGVAARNESDKINSQRGALLATPPSSAAGVGGRLVRRRRPLAARIARCLPHRWSGRSARAVAGPTRAARKPQAAAARAKKSRIGRDQVRALRCALRAAKASGARLLLSCSVCTARPACAEARPTRSRWLKQVACGVITL